MEEEIKNDPTATSSDDSQGATTAIPAVDAENTEEAASETAEKSEAKTEDTAPASEGDKTAEDAVAETPEADAEKAA